MQSLTVFNTAVSTDSENLVSLNDLYRIAEQKSMAAGKMSPRDWARKDIGAGFIDHPDAVFVAKRGKGGGTFADKTTAIAYACYIGGPAMLRTALSLIDDAQKVLDALKGFEVDPEVADAVREATGGETLYVYAIREDASGNVKVGISCNPERRVRQLQTGNSSQLTLMAVMEAKNGYQDEADAHKALIDCHVRGEWYSPDVMRSKRLKSKMATGLAEAIAAEAIENKGSEGYDQCQTECSDAARRVKSIL